MKRALPPFTLMLFWSLFALAQQTCLLVPFASAQTVTCNSSTHTDTNGNPCVNFTTAPHAYPLSNTYVWDSQDGQPIPVGAYGAIDLGYDPTPFLNIAVDPLDNDMSAYLGGGVVTSQMIASTPSYPGYLNYTIQYQFVSTVSDNGYVWQGTFTVEYYRQNVVSCGGRAHRLCSIYAANAGAGELSAIPQ